MLIISLLSSILLGSMLFQSNEEYVGFVIAFSY